MASTAKSDWLVPAGLIALGIVPILAGISRVVQLGSGAEITPDSARFFAAPVPVVVHILCAAIYSMLGALQFSASLRRRHLNWHRAAGRVLIPCGFVVALSGLWMTQFYPRGINPPASFDGPFLYAIRIVVGVAMAVSLWQGLAAVRRRDIPTHQAWMMRSYALGLGAGTQVFTHIPWFVFPALQGELARTLCMGAGWAINIAVAEWLISRGRGKAQSIAMQVKHRQ